MPPPPVTLTFDLLTLKAVSESRVTWALGYLCVHFSLPRPLCSRLRPDERDRRQTDVRRGHNKRHLHYLQIKLK